MSMVNRDYNLLDASKALGMNKEVLMRLLRLGNSQFGFYVPPKREGGQGVYYVYRERVQAYITAQDIKFSCPYAQQHHIESFGSNDMNTEEGRLLHYDNYT